MAGAGVAPTTESPHIMKKFIHLPLLLCAVLALGACSTIGTRINEKSSVFYSLDPDTRAKIAHGDVAIGYTPDMVYIALGAPDVRRVQHTAAGSNEVWIYRTYYDDPSWGMGWGWGPGWWGGGGYGYHRWGPYAGFYRGYWGPAYDPYFRGIPEDDIRVTFRNGRVVMIDQAKV